MRRQVLIPKAQKKKLHAPIMDYKVHNAKGNIVNARIDLDHSVILEIRKTKRISTKKCSIKAYHEVMVEATSRRNNTHVHFFEPGGTTGGKVIRKETERIKN